MAKFKLYSGLQQNLPVTTEDGAVYYTLDTNRLYIDRDYDGEVTRFLVNQQLIKSATSEEWASQRDTIGEKDVFYIYTDKLKSGSGGFLKIGDGGAYLMDQPFVDLYVLDHISNTDIHVTLDEKAFWNDKVSCYLDSQNRETIVFTTD